MKFVVRMSPFIVSIFFAGCMASNSTTDTVPRQREGPVMVKMQSSVYVVKKGDLVELSVLGYPEFQTSTTVKESGAIIVPLLGEIQAAGLTKQQLTDTIRKKLSEFVKGEPEVTIGISNPANQKISVLGAVTRQDNYPVTGELSLLEILSTAGGPTIDADLGRVRILFSGNSNDQQEVDLSSYLEVGNAEGAPKVQPGDVVYVPKKENVVREFSEFLRDAVFIFGAFRLLY